MRGKRDISPVSLASAPNLSRGAKAKLTSISSPRDIFARARRRTAAKQARDARGDRMRRDYKDWLRGQGYGDGTITAQLHRVGRVEEHYGDLDKHFEQDGLVSLLTELTYSTEDERRGKPNPTKIPFVGNARNNLASYKSAVLWYARFRESGGASTRV